MLSSKIKDIKIRNSFNRIEKIKKIKKFLQFNILSQSSFNSSKSLNQDFVLQFSKDSKKMNFKSRVRMTNRCVVNNRGRGVFRPFGVSRILMRNLIQFGLLPGYSKAVW